LWYPSHVSLNLIANGTCHLLGSSLNSWNCKKTCLCSFVNYRNLVHSYRKLLYIDFVPAGWPGSSLRVTCPCELGHLRLAPSVSTWKKWTKGRPRGRLHSNDQVSLARNIKRGHTLERLSKKLYWMTEIVWLELCRPNCLVLTVSAPRRKLGFALCICV